VRQRRPSRELRAPLSLGKSVVNLHDAYTLFFLTVNKRQPSQQQPGRERPFWELAGAIWRPLAGGFHQSGFSFEWQECDPMRSLDWAGSFHPESVEVCLNLLGTGWVACNGSRMELAPGTMGFFAISGEEMSAERTAGAHHQFLSLEFSFPFLRAHLNQHSQDLHPLIRRCLSEGGSQVAGLSGATPITHRHRELLKSLLHPPVLASAQRLWYQSKALEFAAELFFSAPEGETLCTRAKRLAAERVEKAKALLLENLAEPLSLEQLSRKVGSSPFYLSRTFSREIGMTISQWLRRTRLEKAAELLRSGDYNVTEAALEVGYSSLSHFSIAFHEMHGCCPGLYPLRTVTQQKGPSKQA
jgi:AraC-like DNA-binding protein